jgi:UDP-glucose:(heptosyl)LPS alpha-1,3-glucosyltransferase
MKIGLVRRGFSATGGAEAYLKRFAEALLAAKHECVLFTSSDWPQSAWPSDAFHYLKGRSPIEFANALEKADPQSKCDVLFSLERVWKCDCYRAGDGVHRAWLQRRKSVEPVYKRFTRVFNRKHREILTLEKRLFSPDGAKAVIANSSMVKQEIIRYYRYPAEKIHIIYNGLPATAEVNAKLRAETRRELRLTEFDYVILFAGSGWDRKGLKYAVEGVRRANLSGPLLLVAGRGRSGRYPRSSRVRFVGPVKNMNAYYAAADVFVLPTVYDPFSNACLEAISAGLPVITTTANGCSEILQPGVTGEVLDDPSDTEAIARAIEAWADPVRRGAVRPQLQELARRYTIEANVQATVKLLESLR